MGDGKKGLSAAYIARAVDASLKRLGTDYIDLYQSHYDDPETPVEETMEAFNALIKSGKVRYLGASNLSADRIAQSNRYAAEKGLQGYIRLQPLYNLYDRQPFETEYLPTVEAEGLAVITYYALASGFLSGKYRGEADFGKSPRGGGMKKYLNERGFRILKALDRVPAETGAPAAQLALAWQLHQPAVTAPIASATTDKQLQDLIAAADLKLTSEQLALLDEASTY